MSDIGGYRGGEDDLPDITGGGSMAGDARTAYAGARSGGGISGLLEEHRELGRQIHKVNRAVTTLMGTVDKFVGGPIDKFNRKLEELKKRATDTADAFDRIANAGDTTGSSTGGDGSMPARAKAPANNGGVVSGTVPVGAAAVAAAPAPAAVNGGNPPSPTGGGPPNNPPGGGGGGPPNPPENGGGISWGGVAKGLAAVGGIATYAASRYVSQNSEALYSQDLLANRSIVANGGIGSREAARFGITQTSARFGTHGMEDLTQGYATLAGTTGGAIFGTPTAAAGRASMSQAAMMDPRLGSAGGASAFAEMMSPERQWALRRAGVHTRVGGDANDLLSVMQQYSSYAFGAGGPSAEQARAIATPGTRAHAMYSQAMGTGELAQAGVAYLQGSATLGRPITGRRDMREAGLDDPDSMWGSLLGAEAERVGLRGQKNEGLADAIVDANKLKEWWNEQRSGMEEFNEALGKATGYLNAIGSPLSDLAGTLAQIAIAVKLWRGPAAATTAVTAATRARTATTAVTTAARTAAQTAARTAVRGPGPGWVQEMDIVGESESTGRNTEIVTSDPYAEWQQAYESEWQRLRADKTEGWRKDRKALKRWSRANPAPPMSSGSEAGGPEHGISCGATCGHGGGSEKGGTSYAVGTNAPLPASLKGQETISAMDAWGSKVPGARRGSAYRTGSTTYHNKGQATDWAHGAPTTAGYSHPGLRSIFHHFEKVAPKLKELILTGAPYWILSGKKRTPYRGRLWDTHKNHVHVATTEKDLGAGAAVSADEDTDPNAEQNTGRGTNAMIGAASRTASYEEADILRTILEGDPGASLSGGGGGGGSNNGSGRQSGSSMVSGEGAELAVNAARAAGMQGQHLLTMAAIAGAESTFNPRAHNPNAKTGDNSYGLWQINMLGQMGPERRRAFGISSNEELFDPITNARAAQKIFQGQGYKAWSVWRAGKHQQYLDDVQHALQSNVSVSSAGDESGGPISGVDDLREMGGGLSVTSTEMPSMENPTFSEGTAVQNPQLMTFGRNRRASGQQGGQGRTITIQKLEMNVKLMNGSRAEVEKLYDNLEKVAESRANIEKAASF